MIGKHDLPIRKMPCDVLILDGLDKRKLCDWSIFDRPNETKEHIVSFRRCLWPFDLSVLPHDVDMIKGGFHRQSEVKKKSLSKGWVALVLTPFGRNAASFSGEKVSHFVPIFSHYDSF